MADFDVHPLISYSQHEVTPGSCNHIVWDVREPLHSARSATNPEESPSNFDTTQFATNPPLPLLHVVCDIFPAYWPIRVEREGGVTVGDVLHSIHTTLIKRISQEEYDRLSAKQQERIRLVFENRCNWAADRDGCRSHGVIRLDCLLEHTGFAGLSPSFEMDSTCILTLRRLRQ
ncbi:ectomycorrhiza-regulated small secreted protein [Gymnopilus junonius]|uniref:Ectomycorrhiza-regulated small secreted protein n=1 Tax=Gymnopilus junonius TaxID=109634 RepID=A0A9P5NHV5_GYMJU|nr:ectomycorrhiza-regulated small secreted protein [Gymnopilus junonius]